jgi:hypothetical protein
MKPTYMLALKAGLPALLILATSGAAVHYRMEAVRIQRQMEAATAEAGALRAQLADASRRPSPLSSPSGAADPAGADTMVAAHRRIQELERQLEEQGSRMADLRRDRRPPRDGEAPEATAAEPRRERRDWMEELREQDPERYAERVQRQEEARQRVQDSFARKAAHFLERDQASMSDAQRADYETMLGLLGDTWQLAERLQDDQTPREERGEIRRELMSNARILRPMLEQERDQQFYELGRRLGYDESGAVQFVDYITEMVEITSFGSIWQGGRGGRGGSGGR